MLGHRAPCHGVMLIVASLNHTPALQRQSSERRLLVQSLVELYKIFLSIDWLWHGASMM